MPPDTTLKRCFLINMIIVKLEFAAKVWEGNARVVKQLKQ